MEKGVLGLVHMTQNQSGNGMFLVRELSLGSIRCSLSIPALSFNEIKYRYSLSYLDSILDSFFQDKEYFHIDLQTVKETVRVLKEKYLSALKTIGSYFKLQQSTILQTIFLILKHSSMCNFSVQLFDLDLLLAYVAIAWKFNETRPLVVRHFVQSVYSEETDRMGLDWLKKKISQIILLETQILKDLDFKIKYVCVFDLFNLTALCETRYGEKNYLAALKI